MEPRVKAKVGGEVGLVNPLAAGNPDQARGRNFSTSDSYPSFRS